MAKFTTVKAIESAKPKDKEYKLTVDCGLYIRVSTSNVKTWLIRYVVDGVQRQYRLPKPFGSGGEGFMSLVEAKSMNAKIQSLAREGVDYQLHLQLQKQNEADLIKLKNEQSKTVQNMYDDWITDGVKRSDGNKYITQTFEKHLLPSLGSSLVSALTDSDLRLIYIKK